MRPTCILLIAALVAIPAIAGDAAKEAQGKLKGAWTTTEIVKGGQKEEVKIRLEFDGGKLNVTLPNGETATGTYSIDASKTPATMDISIEQGGNTHKIDAIYEIKGDVLRLCHAHGDGGARPTAIEATEKTALATLKRDK